MLITHKRPRPDLNDGKEHEPTEHRKATALHLVLALAAVRAGRPIKTVRVPK